MSEGGEARNHEAEIEAVARAIAALQRALEYPPAAHAAHWQRKAADAIAALDALRRSPQGESGRKGHDPACVLPSAHKGPCRGRPPQGEDHELERLKSECCVCEKCGHVQAEPNWCHKCGHRTSMPDWAKPLVDAFHERNELREAQDEDHEEVAQWRGEDHERFPVTAEGFAATDDRTGPAGEQSPGWPQGEDHEAGIPRWTIYKHSGQWDDVIEGPDTGDEHDGGIEVVPAAYLSGCPSPERDTENLAAALYRQDAAVLANQVDRLVEALRGLTECFDGFDDETEGAVMNGTMAWEDVAPRIDVARAVLAEFTTPKKNA